MYTPSRTCLRITAYHIVVASSVPWMRSHGRGGAACNPSVIPRSTS